MPGSILKDAFGSKYDTDFISRPYQERLKIANNFFDSEIAPDEEYKVMPVEERAAIRRKYVDREVGSTLTGTDSVVHDVFNKFMRGSNRIADLPANMLNLIDSVTSTGIEDHKFGAMADWWKENVSESGYWEAKKPTGKYEVAPSWKKPGEWLDTKLIVGGLAENMPYTVMAMGAYTAAGSIGGAVGFGEKATSALQKAMALATMGITEGGEPAEAIRKAEEATGIDIPYPIQATIPALVGTANAILENIMPENIMRGIPRGAKSRMRAIISNGLLNGFNEGWTEMGQEIVTMIGELGYGDAMPDWRGRLAASLHGGAFTGMVFGAGQGIGAPVKPDIDERVTALPVGKVEGTKLPVTAVSLQEENKANDYIQAVKDYQSHPGKDGERIIEDLRDDLVKTWRPNHPKDVTGEGLASVIEGAGVSAEPILTKIKGTVVPLGSSVEPIKLPDKMKDISSLTLKVPRTDGTHYYVPTTINKGVSHKTASQVITAFSFLRNQFKDVHDKVSELVVTGAKDNEWIKQAIDSGILRGSDGEARTWDDLEALAQYEGTSMYEVAKSPDNVLATVLGIEDFANKQGYMAKLPDGTFKMAIRGGQYEKIEGKRPKKVTYDSSNFVYFVGHEFGHASGKPKTAEMSTEELAKEELAAETAGTTAQELFKEAAAINTGLLFSRTNPRANSPAHNSIVQYRALQTLGHNFSDIKIAEGALYVETSPGKSERVNAMLDPETRTVWLSKDAAPWVFGHEAAHIAIQGLGKEHPLVKQGLAMFNGDEEAQVDAIGKYYENSMTDKGMMQRLGEWLRDLWTEFVLKVGVDLSQEQLLQQFNRRIVDETKFSIPQRTAELQDRRGEYLRLTEAWTEEYNKLKREGNVADFSGSPAAQALDNATYYDGIVKEIDERLKMDSKPKYQMSKLTTTLRFYDNLSKVKGNVNLTQLPLKNLKTEETSFVKSVAQDLIDAGEKTVTPDRLKQAIEAAKIPVSVDVEMRLTTKPLVERPRAMSDGLVGYFGELKHGVDSLNSGAYGTWHIPISTNKTAWANVTKQGDKFSVHMITRGYEETVVVPNNFDSLRKAIETFVMQDQTAETPRQLGEAYTVPGYNPDTHHRWLFTTPIDFGQSAHAVSDIMATNAIGWAEVAEKEDDPKTLMVFEVQPSDKMKDIVNDKGAPDIAFIPYESILRDLKDATAANMDASLFNDHQGFRVSGSTYTAISDENSIEITGTPEQVAKPMFDFFAGEVTKEYSINAPQSVRNIAPHVNSLMYHGILQEAARKGFEKVLFPVGNTVAQIEGAEAPVELYNRMAARMEKELPGQTKKTILGTVTIPDMSRINAIPIGDGALEVTIDNGPATIVGPGQLDSFIQAAGKDAGMETEATWLQVSITPETAEKPFYMFSRRARLSPLTAYFGNKGSLIEKGSFDPLKKVASLFDRVVDVFGGSGMFSAYVAPNIPRVLNDKSWDVINFHEQTSTNAGAKAVMDAAYNMTKPLYTIYDKYKDDTDKAFEAIKLWYNNTKASYNSMSAPEKAALMWFRSAYVRLKDTSPWLVHSGKWVSQPKVVTNRIKDIEGNVSLLAQTILSRIDAEELIPQTGKNDLILLDPPYTSSKMRRAGKIYAEGSKYANQDEAIKFINNIVAPAVEGGKHIVYTNTWTDATVSALRNIGMRIVRDDRTSHGNIGSQSEVIAYTQNVIDKIESSSKPNLMFSKYQHPWRKGFLDNLKPPTQAEKEAAPKRKFKPSIAFGYKGYAETKAAQNIANALPEDIRAIEQELMKNYRVNINDPKSYTKQVSNTIKKKNMFRIAMNPVWVDKLMQRVKTGNIGLVEAGDGELAKFTVEEKIGGLHRGLMKKIAYAERLILAYNPLSATRKIIDDELIKYHQAMNASQISAGAAVQSFDLHHSEDKMFALYEGLHSAYMAGYPKDFMDKYAEFIDKKDIEGATNYKADYDMKHQGIATKGTNALFSLMFEGLLSGAANTKNFSSNTLWLNTNILLLRPLRVGVTSILSSKAFKTFLPSLSIKEQEAYMPEVAAMYKELFSKRAWQRAKATASYVWKYGGEVSKSKGLYSREYLPEHLKNPWDVNVDLSTKWEMEMGSITAPWRAVGLGEAGARALTIFSRSLMVVDALFKSLGFDAQIQALIVREMQRTGKAYHEVEVTPNMKKDAGEFINYITFMDKPGDIAQSAYSMRGFVRKLGLPGRAVIPFVNTLANILQRGIEFTPGLGAISGARDIISEKTRMVTAAQKAGQNIKVRMADTKAYTNMIVNQTAGLLITMVLYGLLHDKDGEERITGAPPTDARDRVSFYATKQPYSIRVGNQWISYRNIEPLNIVLSNIIAFKDAVKKAKNPEELESTGEMLVSASGAIIENVIQSSYMEGFMNLIKDGKINPAALGRIPAEFIPYSSLMRAMQRSYEVYNTGEYAVQDNRSFMAAMAGTLAWLPEEVTHLKKVDRINALGETIRVHVGKGGIADVMKMWLPFGVMEAYTDPVEEELASFPTPIYVSLPSKKMTIRGQEVVLPDDFHREYSLLYGKYTKEALMKAMQSSGYQTLLPEKKIQRLQKAMIPARRRARLVAHRQYVQAYLR